MNQQYGSKRRNSLDQDSEAFFDDHLYFEVHDVIMIFFFSISTFLKHF